MIHTATTANTTANSNDDDDRPYKTLRVTIETYRRLSKLGNLNDSFDTVIRKLLDENKRRLSSLTATTGGGVNRND